MPSETIVEEIEKSGFLLEWIAADIFRKYGYDIELNELKETPGLDHDPRSVELTEVDIFASIQRVNQVPTNYVVECKGANSTDRLVLIKYPKQNVTIPSIYFNCGTVMVNARPSIMCNVENTRVPVLCHTGDFFKKDKNGYSKRSLQDDQNNLFKGARQLNQSINVCCLDRQRASFNLEPLIVTNATILISTLGRSIHVDEVPWCAYRNSLNHRAQWLGTITWSSDLPDGKLFARQRRTPYFWIVNVNHLDAFIKNENRVYPASR